MLKELLRALYAIIDAIKNKNNSGEGGEEQSDYKIKLFDYNSEPAGLIAYKDDVGYIRKYYSIEEIFALTPQQIAEIFDDNVEKRGNNTKEVDNNTKEVDNNVEERFEGTFMVLYKNYDDVKEGVITNLHISIIPGSDPDPDYQEIAADAGWDNNPTIRDVELNGETYYFLDVFNGGDSPIIESE